jgi:hypothetical protein
MKGYPIKVKDTAHRTLVDEAIVVNFKKSFFYNLNQVATFIWDLCDGQHNCAQIVAALTTEFEVTPEEAARDCHEFIESLVKEGLLEWADSPISLES